MRPVGTPDSAKSRLSTPRVDFSVDPTRYRHWRLAFDGPVATLTMDVDMGGGLVPGYELKLNSYDLGVDIELYDAIQRMRFEHPEVRAVVLTSGKEKVFCVGANIRMLAAAPHSWKVNFCTFTNETRNGIEDATANSGQAYVAAVNGSAYGGGYELALACQHIMLIDDQSAAVSLPKLPLLGVGPGTGGLTRLIDKRHVRRDLADYFASKPEGVGGEKAVQWRLVDEAVPQPRWHEAVAERAAELAERSARPADATGIELTPLEKTRTDDEISYRYVTALLEPGRGVAEITVSGPETDAPAEVAGVHEQHAGFWPLAVTRELDDLILDLRINEPELGTWVLRTHGDAERLLAYDQLLLDNRDDWLANEIIHYLKRTLKRLDVTSRSLIALIEPGSCFAGSLLELALAADRSFQLFGVFEQTYPDAEPAAVTIGEMNLGPLPMGNGLTRLETRHLGNDADLAEAEKRAGDALRAEDAGQLGLVTFTPDEADWEKEVCFAIEERANFSPDALAGLEANYRFAGPETMETKIFGRLSAWKNWIFNGPSASGLESMYLREITLRVQQYEKRYKLVDASHPNATNSPVFGAIGYMKGHIGEPISVAELAEGACMSESAFAHHFKQCVGTSPYQFLKLLRLEHARDLLLENHTVSEAAGRVGYASLSHFIREFKRYFGETPRSYIRCVSAGGHSDIHAGMGGIQAGWSCLRRLRRLPDTPRDLRRRRDRRALHGPGGTASQLTRPWHGIRLNRRLRDLNTYLVTWHAVMAEDDLREGEITGIEVAGKKLTLLNVGGEIRPFEDRRLHLNPRISEGDLDSYTLHYVTCAAHLREFDALTGKGTNPATAS